MYDKAILFLRSWLWIILETILYLLVLFGVAVVLTGLISLVSPSVYDELTADTVLDPYLELWSSYLPMALGSIAALWVVHVLILKRELSLTGLLSRKVLSGTAYGGMLSFVMLLIGFLLLWGTGGLRIDTVDFDPYLFFGFFLFFAVQSSFEEIVSRSFLIPTIERHSNVWAAILVSAGLFAVVHGSNPNVSYIALINIGLAGVLLGMLFVRYRSIWPAIGLHVFWNFLQGSFFGFEVSGIDVYSVIETTETGPDLWTGGTFGYEGSLLGAGSLLLTSYIVWRSQPEAFHTLVEYRSPSEDNDIPLSSLFTTDGGIGTEE